MNLKKLRKRASSIAKRAMAVAASAVKAVRDKMSPKEKKQEEGPHRKIIV